MIATQERNDVMVRDAGHVSPRDKFHSVSLSFRQADEADLTAGAVLAGMNRSEYVRSLVRADLEKRGARRP